MTTYWQLRVAIGAIFLAALMLYARAQPTQPERNELFWCQQQRNFAFDTAAKNASEASKLADEVAKLKAEIEELKKTQK